MGPATAGTEDGTASDPAAADSTANGTSDPAADPAVAPAAGAPHATPWNERPARRVLLDPTGPVLVEGPVEVTLPDGRVERCDRFMAALCTCRRSQVFPWCDTSHRRRASARRAGEGGSG